MTVVQLVDVQLLCYTLNNILPMIFGVDYSECNSLQNSSHLCGQVYKSPVWTGVQVTCVDRCTSHLCGQVYKSPVWTGVQVTCVDRCTSHLCGQVYKSPVWTGVQVTCVDRCTTYLYNDVLFSTLSHTVSSDKAKGVGASMVRQGKAIQLLGEGIELEPEGRRQDSVVVCE
jgi:hypothetical protein